MYICNFDCCLLMYCNRLTSMFTVVLVIVAFLFYLYLNLFYPGLSWCCLTLPKFYGTFDLGHEVVRNHPIQNPTLGETFGLHLVMNSPVRSSRNHSLNEVSAGQHQQFSRVESFLKNVARLHSRPTHAEWIQYANQTRCKGSCLWIMVCLSNESIL